MPRAYPTSKSSGVWSTVHGSAQLPGLPSQSFGALPYSSRKAAITHQAISRRQALLKIKRYVLRSPKHPRAVELIQLFHVQAEELLEMGLSYERVRSLDKVLRLNESHF